MKQNLLMLRFFTFILIVYVKKCFFSPILFHWKVKTSSIFIRLAEERELERTTSNDPLLLVNFHFHLLAKLASCSTPSINSLSLTQVDPHPRRITQEGVSSIICFRHQIEFIYYFSSTLSIFFTFNKYFFVERQAYSLFYKCVLWFFWMMPR